MALAFVAATDERYNNTSQAQLTHTVSSGSDRVLVISVAYRRTVDSVTTVTFAGDSVTELFTDEESQGDNAAIWIGYINETDIDTGAGTLVVNFSTSISRVCVGITEYTGASQGIVANQGPFKNSTWDFNSGVHTSSSESTTTDSNGLALGFASTNSGANGGQTVRVDQATTSPTMGLIMNETAGDGGNKSMSFTHGDDTFIAVANCLQVPQALTIDLTGSEAIVASSASIGSVIEGTDLVIIGRTATVAASASVGTIVVVEPLRADMVLHSLGAT